MRLEHVISPLLFALMMEYLNRGLGHVAQQAFRFHSCANLWSL